MMSTPCCFPSLLPLSNGDTGEGATNDVQLSIDTYRRLVYYYGMSKTGTKEKILEAGGDIIHERGFNNTGLNEILAAAGVPKGSFYFYFKSKNDFGLALVDHYVDVLRALHRKNGVHLYTEPDKKLFAFFDSMMMFMESIDYKKGCPIGNLVQEMSDIDEDFREKLNSVFYAATDFIEECLADGIKAGVFKKTDSVRSQAEFIFNSYQGAIMRAKLTKSNNPFMSFRKCIRELIMEK